MEQTNIAIQAIEQQIKALKVKPKIKNIQSKINLLKTQLNQQYNANKEFTIEFEKNNHEYLLLMRSTNNFFKLFEHSALFYTYSIAPKLNLTAKLQDDKDFTHKSSVGFVSIKNPSELAKTFATIKIRKVKTKDQTGNFILFKLPWRYTDKQINDYTENNLLKLQSFNQIVFVDNTIPILFVKIEELLKAIYENVRGMNSPLEREAFGYQIIYAVTKMTHLYLDLANGHIDKLTCLKAMKSQLKIAKYQTKILTDLKIWTPKTCARIGEIIIKIQEIIIHESKNI